MKYIWMSLIALLLIAACGTTVRVPTSVNISEYNSVASQYMTRPTFAEIHTLGDDTRLVLTADAYGNQKHSIYLSKAYVDEYVSLIDKYLRWEDQASNKGDLIEKELGRAGFGRGVSLRFEFYSANPSNHYLVINTISLGSQIDDHVYFAKRDAIELKKLLLDFKNGKINTKDPSIDYN